MLRCLLVQQPYASLIAFGKKRWEFRSYDTKKRGRIGIAASPSSVLPIKNFELNRVSHLFPRGVLLATATLINSFFVTSSDLRKALETKSVSVSLHGHQIVTLDSPVGEPREDVEEAANLTSWESYVWELEDVKPVNVTVQVVKKLPSTWVSVDLAV